MTASFVKEIIGNKKPKVAEIELTLFENCDVVCTFCGHDKESTVGLKLSEMLSKIPLIENFLDSLDDDIEVVNLHLVGGELLQDRLITEEDSILESYSELIFEYIEVCKKRDIKPRILLVTNMLTKKPEIVRNWLEEMGQHTYLKLIASYDLYGRPLPKQYKENIDYFSDYISNINVVVTKEAIFRLLKGDETFNFLYERFPIFMDDFLPDRWTSHLIPSDEDYLKYLECVKSTYPKLLPFGESMDRVKSSSLNPLQFTTFNKCNILPNNKVTNYLWDRHHLEDFEGEANYIDNSNLLLNFIMENECLSCEFYISCPLRCPVSWSWKERERSPGCVNKRFFETVKKES